MALHIKRWGVLAFLVGAYVCLSSALLLWWHTPPYLSDYREGDIWPHPDLFAPFEFRIYKTTEEKGEEIDSLVQHFSLVFQKDTHIAGVVQEKAERLAQRLSPGLRQALLLAVEYAYRYGYVGIPLEDRPGLAVLRYSPQAEREVALQALVDSFRLWRWVEAQVPLSLQDSLKQLLRQLLQVDCLYDPVASEERLRLASQALSPYSGTVRKGELIIRKGEILTKDTEQKLQSLRVAYERIHPLQGRLLSYLGALLLVGIITFIALQYLYISRRFSPSDVRPIALLLTVYLIFTGASALFLRFVQSWNLSSVLPLQHLVPVAMGPLLLAIFFDDRVGFISAIALGAQLSLLMEAPVEFFFVHGFSTMLAVFRLRVMQRRSHLYYALGLLALGYTVSYIGYHLFYQGTFEAIPWAGLPILYLNALLCLMVYPLIYGIEKVFKMSSDITFLELLDTNHPLLKELAHKAPGTFQHSLAVASLAEAAAQAVGAHPLKCHVMALFHDIGKLEAPQYFIENLAVISQGGAENPHHALSPRESAAIIRSHVEYGVYLARRYRLPQEIIAGIRTHHGTTCIQYFWQKQKQIAPHEAELWEEEFRYPGPLPSTKEEAILMLADTLEASTRALSDLTPQKLRDHVRRMIHQRIAEGQLAEAPLTFPQIKELEEAFYQQLLSLHHARIQYTEVEAAPVSA